MVVLYQLSYIGKRACDESFLLSTASADDESLLTSANEFSLVFASYPIPALISIFLSTKAETVYAYILCAASSAI